MVVVIIINRNIMLIVNNDMNNIWEFISDLNCSKKEKDVVNMKEFVSLKNKKKKSIFIPDITILIYILNNNVNINLS